jgi:radical SAM protein with 4Fe4S-binding SPASM domain
MDMELFRRLVDECARYNIFSIRLSWRGEVFTNPNFLNCVRYAKRVNKIPQVSFLTNGLKLKGENAEALIEAGVDYISVSVDGMGEMYEKIRYPSKFDQIYQNLWDFKALKEKMGSKKPQIRITTLWPAIACNSDAYYRKMSQVADKIVYNPLKDYSITTQDRKSFVTCQFLWERLFVGFNGTVHPCSNTKDEFVVGNANQQTIRDIWLGEKMRTLRDIHRQQRRLEISPCSSCSYGVDFEKRWKDRDWKHWDPQELLPQ